MKSRTANLVKGFAIMASVIAVLCLPVSLRAQELRGKIKGRVLDQNKAAVPGATVQVTDASRNVTLTLTTNNDGLFEAPYLLPGSYQVVVEAAGFKKSIQDNVQVEINQTRDLELSVEVGAAQETVTVTADAPTLNGSDANLGQTVDRKRVDELPSVHGDPYHLMNLTPGVAYTGSTRLDRDRKSTRLNSSHSDRSRMPSSA